MDVAKIRGATRLLGQPKSWDEKKHGEVQGLPIRDEKLDDGKGGLAVMRSIWIPTPQEIEMLRKGHPIVLSVVGTTHPPVSITVGDISERWE